jgi:hypothetical protein
MFYSFSITSSITSYIILKNNFYNDPAPFQPSIIGTDIYYVLTSSLVEALQPPMIPTCECLMLSCLPLPSPLTLEYMFRKFLLFDWQAN